MDIETEPRRGASNRTGISGPEEFGEGPLHRLEPFPVEEWLGSTKAQLAKLGWGGVEWTLLGKNSAAVLSPSSKNRGGAAPGVGGDRC